jgi:hypothetical protein
MVFFVQVSDRQTPTATLHEDPKTSEVNRVKDLQVEVKGPVLAGDLLGTPEMDKGGVGVTISAVVSATSSMKSCLSTPCSSPIGNVKGGGNISCHLGEGHDRKVGAGDDGDMSVKSSATSPVKSGRFTSRSSTTGSTASVTSSWAAKTKVGIGLYFQRSQNGTLTCKQRSIYELIAIPQRVAYSCTPTMNANIHKYVHFLPCDRKCKNMWYMYF